MRQLLLLAALTLPATTALAQQLSATSGVDRQRAQGRYEEGWRALAAESWADAERHFRAATELDPTFKLAYYGLGRSDMALKRFDKAASAYEKCRDLYAAAFGARMSGRVDVDQLIAEDSLQIDMAIQQLSKGNVTNQKQTQIAQLQNQKQRLQLKGHGLADMSISDGVPPFVTLALGSAYFRGERLADAENAYKAVIQADPKTGEAYNNLAVVYLMTGRVSAAERAVQAAEKAGYRVSPALKDDIKKNKG
jgi:tetratricopeptide (TPR) repeat protein